VRGLVPSSTLLLVHWDNQEALYFHSLYNKLNALDTSNLYWNFTDRNFQWTHPVPTRQQQTSPATFTDSPASHASSDTTSTRPVDSSPAPSGLSFAFMSIDSLSYALQSSSLSPQHAKKYYAIRRGRYPSLTIVESWDVCKQLVHGFSSSEYKSFRTLSEATHYLRGSDQSLVCLHHDDGHLSELPPPVEGGHIIPGPPKLFRTAS
jgi:hypothetical protein